MAGAPGAPRSHGFFQRFQKRHFWRAMPGGIHRGVPTALGSFFQKEKKKKEKEEKKIEIAAVQKYANLWELDK